MKRSVLIKLKAFNKMWSKTKSDSLELEDGGLLFSTNWIDELESILRRWKYDKEFTGDIVSSAHKFFLNEMDDQQKADSFAYLLGKYIRKM